MARAAAIRSLGFSLDSSCSRAATALVDACCNRSTASASRLCRAVAYRALKAGCRNQRYIVWTLILAVSAAFSMVGLSIYIAKADSCLRVNSSLGPNIFTTFPNKTLCF
jgi:hypothetical protein